MKNLVLFLVPFLFIGCSTKENIKPKKVEVQKKEVQVKSQFDYIDGFHDDNLDLAFDVFKKACEKSYKKQMFRNVCQRSYFYNDGKQFFTKYFTPKLLVSTNNNETGLVTGYYEPLLYGSRTKDDVYKYPIYKTPKDLVTIKNKRAYPHFKKRKYKAKIVKGRYVPYDTREQIEKRDDLEPIVYVNDKLALFFLHIQGSGRVQLENGEILNIGYANQNGRKYYPVGRKLVEDGYYAKEDVSMQTIKSFLEANPHLEDEFLNLNESYIFFTERKETATGSLNVPLVPKRNIAVDRRYIPLGMPVFLQTKNPATKEPINKLVVAADTGGAIKGEIRVDYFFGYGSKAEELAGIMKEQGKLYILVPNI